MLLYLILFIIGSVMDLARLLQILMASSECRLEEICCDGLEEAGGGDKMEP